MFGRDAIALLVTQLQQATASVTPTPIVAAGWPQLDLLTNTVATGVASAISVYDSGKSRDASRFMIYTANEVLGTVGISSAVSLPRLNPSGTVTVTLFGTVNTNDAVSFVVGYGPGVEAAIVEATTGATLDTMATALASEINTALTGLVTATVSGAVVTVTNATQSILMVASNVGNIGTRYIETDRKVRDIQVDVWTNSDAQRTVIGRLVDQQLAYLDATFGMQGVGGSTDDGTWVRVRNLGDRMNDADVLKDLYRWTWNVTLEHAQTYAENLYSVLAFVPSMGVQSGEWTADVSTTTADSIS